MHNQLFSEIQIAWMKKRNYNSDLYHMYHSFSFYKLMIKFLTVYVST